MPSLLVYGLGYTGRLILERARRDLSVVAAARRVPAGSDALALDVNDRDGLRAAVSGCGAVLNCAGPFTDTWRPLVEACLETGAHYLDITGEWQVFEGIHALDARAAERGVMLLPGVGYDVVATDCLVAHVAGRLPDARRLQLGISALEIVSRGSARTIMTSAGTRVRVRRGTRIVEEPRLLETSFDFGSGSRPAYAVSWGDVSTAFHTTGIPDVEVYFEATPLVTGLDFLNRTFGWLMQNPALARLGRAPLALLPEGPAPHVRAALRTVAVARALDAAGRRAESRLVTPEAYSFTVETAVAIARRVLAGDVKPGFQTPARLLGADFVLGFEGVTREDRALA